jgi:hypothetical protein
MTAVKSQNHLAALLGVSKSLVSRQIAMGMPGDDLEAAQAWRAANISPARKKGARADKHRQPNPAQHAPANTGQGGDTDPPPEDFNAARTRREVAEANKAEMEQAEMQGKFLIKADFERHLFTAGRMLRDTLTNCSRRIGAEVAGSTNPDECEAIIDREHRAALASFAQALRMSIKVAMDTPA